jgi:hypothetical protein
MFERWRIIFANGMERATHRLPLNSTFSVGKRTGRSFSGTGTGPHFSQ